MKRLKMIACKVFYREISLLSCKAETVLDVTYLRQGLHDTPEVLLKTLQAEIDRIDAGEDLYSAAREDGRDFDAILLGYGLCSNAVCGLSSQRYPLVIPRAHDCVTLFLGSKDAYQKTFDEHHGGVYWYTRGWNENCLMPGKERVEALRAAYAEKYGEENADYLMEMEQNWLKEYQLCAYVDWPELNDEGDAARSQASADWLGWRFERIRGDSGLFARFLRGDWNPEEFLVVEPGRKVSQTYDKEILGSAEVF